MYFTNNSYVFALTFIWHFSPLKNRLQKWQMYTMLCIQCWHFCKKRNCICFKSVTVGQRSQKLYHAYNLGSIPRLPKGILCNLQKASWQLCLHFPFRTHIVAFYTDFQHAHVIMEHTMFFKKNIAIITC